MEKSGRENPTEVPHSDNTERPAGVSRRQFLRNTGLVMAGAAVAPAATQLTRAQSAWAAAASEPVSIVVQAGAGGRVIPRDFTGLSFERGALNSGNAGVPGYFFSASNTELVTLFRNAGIKNLRIGGNTVDMDIPAGTGSDGYTGVDNLFGFAAAAGANVIYSLRMQSPSSNPIPNLVADDASAAQYIWQRYQSLVNSFSIGNEPDWHSYHLHDPAIYETTPGEPGSAYPSYLADWRKFAGAILDSVPAAMFSGPDTGNYGTRGGVPYVTYTPTQANGVSWTEKFTDDEGGSGHLKDATQHIYVGGSPFDTTADQAIANMLSTEWVEGKEVGYQPAGSGSRRTAYVPYPWVNEQMVAPSVAAGFPVRLTESNDYLFGIPGASDRFAAALWALDYMHWWAAQGVSGVDFHNKQWIPTDTVTPGLGSYVTNPGSCSAPGCGNYRVTPKGYAMKAFDLGTLGAVQQVTVGKPADLNLTAYAVGSGNDVYVTVINKTYGAGAKDAAVSIVPTDFGMTDAASMTLAAGEPGNAASQTATLGGAEISNNAPWQGKWTPLSPDGSGRVALTVPATTATVVRIHR